MMARIYHILAMSCIVVALSVLGLLGWLAATGRFSADNREALVGWLRGEPLVEPVEEPVEVEVVQVRQTASSAVEELALSERNAERTNLLVQRALQEVKYKDDLLRHREREIRQQREELAALRLQLAEEIAERQQKAGDAGFQRQLKLLETVNEKQAKDILVNMPEELAARYLAAMKKQAAADVIGRFRTPAEQAKLQRLLALMQDV